MKKWIFALLLMVFAGSAFAEDVEYLESQYQRRSGRRNQSYNVKGICGLDPEIPFTIGSYATNPPFSWVDIKDGSSDLKLGKKVLILNGYNADFMKKMAQDLKMNIRVLAFPTDQAAFQALQRGQISAFIGMYYDPSYVKAGFNYVVPSYFSNIIGTVTLKSKNLEINTLDDLKNFKGAVRVDERFYNYIRLTLPQEVNIQQVPDSQTAFTKLLNGEVDYILASPYSAEAEARRYKMNQNIKLKSLPLPPQELFIVLSPRSPCRKINRIISQYLTRRNSDKNARVQNLIKYIDAWGQRFRSDKGLAESIKKEDEQTNLPLKPETAKAEDRTPDTEKATQEQKTEKTQEKAQEQTK